MLENVATRDWEYEFKRGERLKETSSSIPLLEHLQLIEKMQGIIDEKDAIIQTLTDKG